MQTFAIYAEFGLDTSYFVDACLGPYQTAMLEL